jgi:hypothetical protein
MPGREISLAVIGSIARQALAQSQPASVMGKTSRGLFARLASGWVIFLSFENHRGPLTLNLAGYPAALAELESGSAALCSPIEISFPTLGLSLPLARAETWQPPAPPADMLPSDELRAHLREATRLAAQRQNAGPLHRLLPLIVDGGLPADPPEQDFYPRLRRLQAACRDRQTPAIAAALCEFLGLGPGLTPSGDDLVMGFLLAINRWGQPRSTGIDIHWLNLEIPARANSLTSALSASLIACAARGQADERLIAGLDGIVTGNRDAGECVTGLSGWGSSSGFDALVGMAIAMHNCPPPNDHSATQA